MHLVVDVYAFSTHLVIVRIVDLYVENEEIWVFTHLKNKCVCCEWLKVRNEFGIELTPGIAIPKSLAKGGFTRSLPTSRRIHGMLLVGADG